MITTLITILVAVAGTSGGVWAFVKKVWPFLRRIVHFLDDWLGREETDGHERQPGVMGRLQNIESVQADHSRLLEVVLHEIFPNSGASLRDGLNRTEADVAEIKRLIYQQNRGPEWSTGWTTQPASSTDRPSETPGTPESSDTSTAPRT